MRTHARHGVLLPNLSKLGLQVMGRHDAAFFFFVRLLLLVVILVLLHRFVFWQSGQFGLLFVQVAEISLNLDVVRFAKCGCGWVFHYKQCTLALPPAMENSTY